LERDGLTTSRERRQHRAASGLCPRRPLAFEAASAGRACVRAVCAAALLLPAFPAVSQQIRISGGDCGQPVHLVAREAPLSSVLQRLADSLRFKLAYESERDPLVSVDERLAVTDLVGRLARDVNFSMEQVIDARCSQARVSKLSILPDRPDGSPRKAAARPAWQTPEMERIAKQGLSDYLRSHGMEDKPVEELAVH
jgi:hypothetical protein